MQQVDYIFSQLWQQYLQVTPSAQRIHQLLATQETVVNDHIALRTFRDPRIGIDQLALAFEAAGYRACGEYEFKAKKLYARHYEHPDPLQPKVFISELILEQCSVELQQRVADLLAQLPKDEGFRADLPWAGRLWQLNKDDYTALAQESEYAAWLAAWGFRANHFTVSVNHLSQYDSLQAVNQALLNAGFILNRSGGEIKGIPADLLEQSSTMADRMNVVFSDGELEIPSCFYEFARRYPQADGSLYTGFIAANADKIFESTNA